MRLTYGLGIRAYLQTIIMIAAFCQEPLRISNVTWSLFMGAWPDGYLGYPIGVGRTLGSWQSAFVVTFRAFLTRVVRCGQAEAKEFWYSAHSGVENSIKIMPSYIYLCRPFALLPRSLLSFNTHTPSIYTLCSFLPF